MCISSAIGMIYGFTLLYHNQMLPNPTRTDMGPMPQRTKFGHAPDSEFRKQAKQCNISRVSQHTQGADHQDLTHQICDMMTSPPQQHRSLPPSCRNAPVNRIRKEKKKGWTKAPHRAVPRGRREPGTQIEQASQTLEISIWKIFKNYYKHIQYQDETLVNIRMKHICL